MHATGFNGTGVKEITDRAGVPKGSFYAYFPGKEEFAAEALTHYLSGKFLPYKRY
jgi:TetR/AcrR family transcriptional regulator, transcriptional repressor for nem operon